MLPTFYTDRTLCTALSVALPKGTSASTAEEPRPEIVNSKKAKTRVAMPKKGSPGKGNSVSTAEDALEFEDTAERELTAKDFLEKHDNTEKTSRKMDSAPTKRMARSQPNRMDTEDEDEYELEMEREMERTRKKIIAAEEWKEERKKSTKERKEREEERRSMITRSHSTGTGLEDSAHSGK